MSNRTDCLKFLSTGLGCGYGQEDGSILQALQPMPRGRDLQVAVLTQLPALFARHQPHPALQDLERRCPRSVVFGQVHAYPERQQHLLEGCGDLLSSL
jgi:hypothetical protein